jgi:lipoprotein-anchoring transpeptidase ErfK/SrfK
MMTTATFTKKLGRFTRAAALATAYLCAGAFVPGAQAAITPADKTTVIVPKAKPKSGLSKAAFKRGKIVEFSTNYAPGSVIIVSRTNNLYFVLGGGKAVQYRVATAKKGFEWSGANRVSSKTKWPDWRPPKAMRERRPELPEYMAGGPENPLGARAIYLGSSIYRIHGTNEPSSIGKRASSGCIRMLNSDVTELYQNVQIGALVIVM